VLEVEREDSMRHGGKLVVTIRPAGVKLRAGRLRCKRLSFLTPAGVVPVEWSPQRVVLGGLSIEKRQQAKASPRVGAMKPTSPPLIKTRNSHCSGPVIPEASPSKQGADVIDVITENGKRKAAEGHSGP